MAEMAERAERARLIEIEDEGAEEVVTQFSSLFLQIDICTLIYLQIDICTIIYLKINIYIIIIYLQILF